MTKNNLFIKFYGLKRSGNHPVINWLTSHFPKPVWFLNNIVPYSDPFLTNYDWRLLNNCVDFWKKDKELNRMENKEYLMVSYEDFDISHLEIMDIIPNQDPKIGECDKELSILLIRDPFNMMASRLKSQKADFRTGPKMPANKEIVEIWKSYAKEYTAMTNYLNYPMVLNFNYWFSDKEYRKMIIDTLEKAVIGMKFTDEGIDVVPETGEGSSFDARTFDGKAQKMGILDRWQSYKDDDSFWDLFDEETIELADKIFDEMDASKYWKEWKKKKV